MAHGSTVRRIVTLLVLLMAASEIFACQWISPDSCSFYAHKHSNGDSEKECSGDGCLCCCAHIVVIAPAQPLAALGFVARAVPFEEIQTPEFPLIAIEHPPRS